MNTIRPSERDKDTGGRKACGWNALKDGLRSKLRFPAEMAEAIAVRAAEFTEALAPQTALEEWLAREMARSTVQMDVCSELLLVDDSRVLYRADNCWDDDRCEQVDKVAARLSENPSRVARALERSKQGTALLLSYWDGLNAALLSDNAWDEAERQFAFDLLGTPQALRSGISQVPAGTDAPGLRALVNRQRSRLEARLEKTLNARDKATQGMAQLGIPIDPDASTRRLKSNESRAQRRLVWALATFERLRLGIAPSEVIDPETRKPLAAEAPHAAAPTSAQSAPPPTPTPPPPTPRPPSRPPLPPLPEECQGESREMMLVAAEALRALMASPNATLPPGFLPVSDAGPPRG